MKKFRTIEIGSNVAFYSKAGSRKIEGSDKPNGSYLSRKMFYTTPIASGIVTKIKGHNAYACQITFDNGKTFEMGLDTHYHLNGEIGECLAHQNHYSIS